jgi:tryptophan-rich sensory protein
MKRPDYAVGSLLLSWLIAIKAAKTFQKASPAGLLMIPLCLWLTLVMELNAEFLLRNRGRMVIECRHGTAQVRFDQG